jgi:hypothetical protein
VILGSALDAVFLDETLGCLLQILLFITSAAVVLFRRLRAYKTLKRRFGSIPHPMASNSDVEFSTNHSRCGFPMAVVAHAFSGYGEGEMPRSKAELEIMQFAGSIRDKPLWWNKVRDPSITNRWQAESLNSVNDSEADCEYRTRQFLFALRECQWQAMQYPGPGRPAAVDRAFSSDGHDESELWSKLLSEINKLRSLPAVGSNKEDRHPGTPQMVDLVHPSLYAYERGKTEVLPHVPASMSQMPPWDNFLGVAGVTEIPPRKIDGQRFFSPGGLQWLPAEFRVNAAGDSCKISSYINSLHPTEFAELYDSIGELFCRALPLLENTLREAGHGPLEDGEHWQKNYRERDHRVPIVSDWWEAPRSQLEGEDDDLYYDYLDDFHEIREFIPPEIPDFTPPSYNVPEADVSLRNCPLQVIVKVASLEIEPGESYEGGVWHVEGTLDERIVATACCYLDNTNVQGGDLAFRVAVAEPDYEQGDDTGVRNVYGLEDDEPLVQFIGSCSTPTGRILAWPNTLQHRVGPVRLIDESKYGKRLIVCFFLVDPTLRIRSTATVPPQQLAWVSDMCKPILNVVGSGAAEPGIQNMIVARLASPSLLTYDQSCERRNRLMEERRAIYEKTGGYDHQKFYERPFSLCEH